MSKLKFPTSKILLYKYKSLQNGEHPVMLRVTFNRAQRYYSLSMSSTVDRWSYVNEDGGEKDKGRYKKDKEKNIKLNAIEARVAKIFNEIERDGLEFTFDRFEKRFTPSSKPHYVLKFTEAVVADLIDEKRLGTAYSYRDTLNRIKDFKSKDFTFHDIDHSFLTGWVKHLSKKNGANSIGIYLRTLRAIYNRAIKEGLIKRDHYPFIGFDIPSEKPLKRALKLEQMTALKNYKAEPGSRLWHSLNLFLFSYYCRGINFADIARLTWKDIENDRIYYKREKTKRKKNASFIDIAITSNIAAILANYSTSDHYIFPIIVPNLKPTAERYRLKTRLKKANKDLQTIVAAVNNEDKEIKIPEDITFYWARHSYATILKRKGISTSLIKESLGHESEKTTQAYLDSFERAQLDELSQHL